jgi:hypothetical protein
MVQWVDRAKEDDGGRLGVAFVAYEPPRKSGSIDGIREIEIGGATREESEPLDLSFKTEEAIMRCCEEILHQGFETIVGLSLGRYGCPFLYVDLRLKVKYAKQPVKENRHHIRGERPRFATFPGT